MQMRQLQSVHKYQLDLSAGKIVSTDCTAAVKQAVLLARDCTGGREGKQLCFDQEDDDSDNLGTPDGHISGRPAWTSAGAPRSAKQQIDVKYST